MDYALPQDIAVEFKISLQTVYNFLKKHGEKIRTRKEYWKTFICFQDFKNIIQPESKSNDIIAESKEFKSALNEVENFENEISKLKSDNRIAAEKLTDLEKYNLNLSDQMNKYAILLADEKNEKKDIMGKYDALQKDFHDKVESLYREKSGVEKKYSFSVWIAVFLLLLVAGISILFFFGKIAIR